MTTDLFLPSPKDGRRLHEILRDTADFVRNYMSDHADTYEDENDSLYIGDKALIEALDAATIAALEHDPTVCEYCLRTEDELHKGDCLYALAQDYSDGSISEKDDSFSDAKAAFEKLTAEGKLK